MTSFFDLFKPVVIRKSKNSRRHTKPRPKCAFLRAVIKAKSANVSRRPNTRPELSTGFCGDGTPAHCALVFIGNSLLIFPCCPGLVNGGRRVGTTIIRCRGSPVISPPAPLRRRGEQLHSIVQLCITAYS